LRRISGLCGEERDVAVEKLELRRRILGCGESRDSAVEKLASRQISGVCGGENDIAVEQGPARRLSVPCGDTRSRHSSWDSYEVLFPTLRCISRYARISARASSWVVPELRSLGASGSGKGSATWRSPRSGPGRCVFIPDPPTSARSAGKGICSRWGRSSWCPQPAWASPGGLRRDDVVFDCAACRSRSRRDVGQVRAAQPLR